MVARGRTPDDDTDSTRIGRFEVLKRLRKGGRGTVFAAREVGTGQQVALKILPPDLTRNNEARERFLRSARAAVGLDHPHIVRGIDVGEARGACYFATELAEGPTLQEQIARHGPFDERKALETLGPILLALGHAATRGLVHGRLCADAVILCTDGVVRLTGLGVGGAADEPAEPHYASPEQARGETDPDSRTDVYAAGVLLYQMLTGHVPFDGPTPAAILARHIAEPPPPLTDLEPAPSPGIQRLVEAMLAKDPAARPPGPRAVLDAVHALLDGEDWPRVERPEPAPPGSARRRRKLVAGVAAAALAVALVAVIVSLASRGPTPARPERPAPQPGEAKAAYQQAIAAFEADPDDIDGAMERLQQVRAAYAGTEAAGLAAAKLEELTRRRDESAKAAYEAALSHDTAALEGLEAALADLRALPSRYPGTEWAEKAEAQVTELEAARLELEARAERERHQEQKATEIVAACQPLIRQDRFADALKRVHEAVPEIGQERAVAIANDIMAEADRRYREIVHAAETALAQKDYAGARAALRPALGFGVPRVVQQAERKLAEIASRAKHADTWAEWERTRDRARSLAVAGKYDEALAALGRARGLAIEDIAKRVADEAKAVQETQRKAAGAAMAIYAERADKVWALLRERRYDEAEKLLRDLEQAPAYAPAGERLAADLRAIGLLRSFWAAVERGLAERRGSFLALAGAGGKIVKVADGKVVLDTPDGVVTRSVLRMTAGQAAAYADIQDDPRSRLMLGLFLLAESVKLDEARRALEAAGDAPDAAIHRQRLAAALQPVLQPPGEPEPTPEPDVSRTKPGTWHELFAQNRLGGWRPVGPALDAVRDPKRIVEIRKGGVMINVPPATRPELPAGGGEQQRRAVAGIEWIGDFPATDYEVRLEVTCLGGSTFFCGVAFPAGQARWSFSLAAEGAQGQALLTPTRGFEGPPNPILSRLPFTRGRWYELRLRVTGDEVRAWLNGKDIRSLPVSGAPRIAGPYSTQGVGGFGVGAEFSRVALRDLQVRRLPTTRERPAERKPGTAAP